MHARLAHRAASALIDAMHRAARYPEIVYLDVPAPWRADRIQAAGADAAARELGPFAMRQSVERFALRFVVGLAKPVLVVQWHGQAGAHRLAIP